MHVRVCVPTFALEIARAHSFENPIIFVTRVPVGQGLLKNKCSPFYFLKKMLR